MWPQHYCWPNLPIDKNLNPSKTPWKTANCTFFCLFIGKKPNTHLTVRLSPWCHSEGILADADPKAIPTNNQEISLSDPCRIPQINTWSSLGPTSLCELSPIDSWDMEHVRPRRSQGQQQSSKLCRGRPRHQTSVSFSSPPNSSPVCVSLPFFGPVAKQNTDRVFPPQRESSGNPGCANHPVMDTL